MIIDWLSGEDIRFEDERVQEGFGIGDDVDFDAHMARLASGAIKRQANGTTFPGGNGLFGVINFGAVACRHHFDF